MTQSSKVVPLKAPDECCRTQQPHLAADPSLGASDRAAHARADCCRRCSTTPTTCCSKWPIGRATMPTSTCISTRCAKSACSANASRPNSVNACTRASTRCTNRADAEEEEAPDFETAVDSMSLVKNDDLEISVAVAGIVSKVTSQFSLPVMQLTRRIDSLCPNRTVTERMNPLGPAPTRRGVRRGDGLHRDRHSRANRFAQAVRTIRDGTSRPGVRRRQSTARGSRRAARLAQRHEARSEHACSIRPRDRRQQHRQSRRATRGARRSRWTGRRHARPWRRGRGDQRGGFGGIPVHPAVIGRQRFHCAAATAGGTAQSRRRSGMRRRLRRARQRCDGRRVNTPVRSDRSSRLRN